MSIWSSIRQRFWRRKRQGQDSPNVDPEWQEDSLRQFFNVLRTRYQVALAQMGDEERIKKASLLGEIEQLFDSWIRAERGAAVSLVATASGDPPASASPPAGATRTGIL